MIPPELSKLVPSDKDFQQLLASLKQDLEYGVWEDLKQLTSHYSEQTIGPCEFDRLSRYVLEYTWEKLHSGHWKNVPDCWRIAYAYVRMLRGLYTLTTDSGSDDASQCELFKSALKEFDYSLLLGYPIFDAAVTRLASVTHDLLEGMQPHELVSKKPKRDSLNSITTNLEAFDKGDRPIHALERVHRPSLERFFQLLIRGQPFILTGAMEFWPACRMDDAQGWSIESWRRRVGHRIVPIEIGSRYTDETWGQELMTVNEFIDRYVENRAQLDGVKTPVGYLAQHQLFLQIPELGEDVYTPDYCLVGGKPECDEATVDSNVWFGPGGTISPLHHDSDRANLLTQIQGYKYVILYTADQSPALYPHLDQMLCNTSMVDAEHPDLSRFPDFARAEGFHGVLSPTEMLYIPPRCWHYIRALSTSFSVNFWWNVCDEYVPLWSSSN